MPPSLDPGRAFVPSHEDDGGFGELLLPATFVREFFFLAAGASFRSASLSRRLAARRYCPCLLRRRGPQRL